MTLHWIDHLFAVLLALAVPFSSYYSIRRYKAEIEAGATEKRGLLMRSLITEEWVALAVLSLCWVVMGRCARELGLGLQPGGAVGYAVAAVMCLLVLGQMVMVTRSAEGRASFRETVRPASFLLPHTLQERRLFDGLSVTAGVCEEIIYRGFLISYLTVLLGTPFWGAALLSSVIFGLGHTYQGPVGFGKTAMVGAAMALLVGLTGSVWAAIVVHAWLDLAAGRMYFAAVRDNGPETSSDSLTAAAEQPAGD